MLLVQEKDEVWEDFVTLVVVDVTTPSYNVIAVASETLFKEENVISTVDPGNIEDFIKVLPDATPDPPPDLSVEKIGALFGSNLASSFS